MKTLSRNGTLPAAVGVWFAPALLLPQLLSNGLRFWHAVSLLPLMHGYALARFFTMKPPSPQILLFSAVLPGVLLLGLLCSSYRRTLLICAAIASCFLTACAYALLIA